jgi:hypothetical protein
MGTMNKKLITALVALTLVLPTTAHAALKNQTVDSKPSLAIIDTALDTSIPEFAGKIVYEVCIIEWSTCSNGKSFMEGPGSAGMPLAMMQKNGFDHGTQMVSSALQTNPNINIVFIRIIGNTANGSRQTLSEKTVNSALQWVIDNRTKFNIQALSMSQGSGTFLPGANYCPVMPNTNSIISELKSAGVPSFFPTGNSKDYKRISWPSCVSDSIAVSATMPGDYIAKYANFDPNLTDFFAIGSLSVKVPGNRTINATGTSIAAQVAAATWVGVKAKSPSMSYQEVYDLLIAKSVPVASSNASGKMIDPWSVLNG